MARLPQNDKGRSNKIWPVNTANCVRSKTKQIFLPLQKKRPQALFLNS